MTFAEFEQLLGKQELIDGEPIQFPPPKFHDSKIANRFSRLLFECARGAQANPLPYRKALASKWGPESKFLTKAFSGATLVYN